MSRGFIAVALIILFLSCKENAEDLVHRGIVYADKGKYKEAIKIYSSVIKGNYKLQTPYYNRGICYAKVKDFPKALAGFNKVISLQKVGVVIITINPNS